MIFKRILSLFFCAALALSGCSLRQEVQQPDTLPEISVSATPASAPPPGSYYNSHTDVGLLLDSEGVFAMFSGESSLKGTYALRGDDIAFTSGTEETLARMDEAGLIFEDMPGVFLPVGVAESFSALGVMLAGDREYMDMGDGTWQVCDYALGLAFVYPGQMSAPEGLLPDAAVVWDGKEGFVVGRNVSGDCAGAETAFLEAYMAEQVLSDFEELYHVSGSYETCTLLQENIPGRPASAEALIVTAQARYYVKVIMYTSTYADGTVNLICKGFYAPEGDTAAFNAMANGVTDMTAVRRR